MDTRNPSFTKKGPGRRHVYGDGKSVSSKAKSRPGFKRGRASMRNATRQVRYSG